MLTAQCSAVQWWNVVPSEKTREKKVPRRLSALSARALCNVAAAFIVLCAELCVQQRRERRRAKGRRAIVLCALSESGTVAVHRFALHRAPRERERERAFECEWPTNEHPSRGQRLAG